MKEARSSKFKAQEKGREAGFKCIRALQVTGIWNSELLFRFQLYPLSFACPST